MPTVFKDIAKEIVTSVTSVLLILADHFRDIDLGGYHYLQWVSAFSHNGRYLSPSSRQVCFVHIQDSIKLYPIPHPNISDPSIFGYYSHT